MLPGDGDSGYSGDGPNILDTLLRHPGVLVAVVVAAGVLLLVLSVAGWILWRRLKRSGAVARGVLQAKAQGLAPGPARDIASLRLRLAGELEYTRNSLLAAQQAGGAPGDLSSLTARLLGTGQALDTELALLERDPDRSRQRTAVATAGARVDEVRDTGARIRTGLAAFVGASDEVALRELASDVAIELDALQAGTQSLRRQAGE